MKTKKQLTTSSHKTESENRTQNMLFHLLAFTGKEKDSETGYCYFGARYYDSDLSGLFLSVDPMSDKYPSISPYAYCIWNPVKLVDPDGRDIGDYYDQNGNYKGWDGKFDNRVYIVDNKAPLAKDNNDNVDASKVKPLVTTTYETLEEIVKVFNRTKGNGGGLEESSAMLADYIGIPGETGYSGFDGKPHCNLPSLTEEQQALFSTSIQSHPFTKIGENNYYKVTPSIDDKALFKNCYLNIIVGNISTPTPSSMYPKSIENIGAVFFDSTYGEKARMNIRSIIKIINNRQTEKNKHWEKIIKGL